MDLHGGLQTVFRFGPGEILGVQHGPRRKTHHGYNAGGSLRELPKEKLPGRLRRLLRGQYVDAGAKTCKRDFERDREPHETNSCANQTSGQFFGTLRAHPTAAGGPSLVHSAYLERANHVSDSARGSPPTDQDETIRRIRKQEGRNQNPDVDIAPRADAAKEAIEV